jgi:hypothetical protein
VEERKLKDISPNNLGRRSQCTLCNSAQRLEL